MNIFGHESTEASPMSDENGPVEAETPKLEPATAPAAGDAEIIDALARKERERAAQLLVAEHGRAIGRLCMALLGSQSEAEDALQETLVAALDGLEAFRDDGTLRAWLGSIARRRCARRSTERSREHDAKQLLRAGETSAETGHGERLSMARRARLLLHDVRPTEREALVLRFAAELSFREVGEACGIDEVAARKRVSRGLARLRAVWGEDES